MNFYDINRSKFAGSRSPLSNQLSADYYAKKRLTMPRNAANSSTRRKESMGSNDCVNPAARGFDAKKLYKERL